jgi:hypothetical protein
MHDTDFFLVSFRLRPDGADAGPGPGLRSQHVLHLATSTTRADVTSVKPLTPLYGRARCGSRWAIKARAGWVFSSTLCGRPLSSSSCRLPAQPISHWSWAVCWTAHRRAGLPARIATVTVVPLGCAVGRLRAVTAVGGSPVAPFKGLSAPACWTLSLCAVCWTGVPCAPDRQ